MWPLQSRPDRVFLYLKKVFWFDVKIKYRSIRICERITDLSSLQFILLCYFLHPPTKQHPISKQEIPSIQQTKPASHINCYQYCNFKRRKLKIIQVFLLSKVSLVYYTLSYVLRTTYPFSNAVPFLSMVTYVRNSVRTRI